eukprot:634018-Rhodomonas_salina.3
MANLRGGGGARLLACCVLLSLSLLPLATAQSLSRTEIEAIRQSRALAKYVHQRQEQEQQREPVREAHFAVHDVDIHPVAAKHPIHVESHVKSHRHPRRPAVAPLQHENVAERYEQHEKEESKYDENSVAAEEEKVDIHLPAEEQIAQARHIAQVKTVSIPRRCIGCTR